MTQHEKTVRLTTGAMFIAIFALILLINRQTGMLFQEFIFFLLPIPMVAFSAKYGLKSGLPVWIGMSLISILFGSVTTIFYAVTEALIGLIFGSCLKAKMETGKVLMLIMSLSSITNVLNTIVFASFFGYNLTEEISEMQNMLTSVFKQTGIALPEAFLSSDYLMRIMVISMVILGLLQGFLIYQLSLLILRRLRFQIVPPKSIFLFFPPKWTGFLAGVCSYAYLFTAANTNMDPRLSSIIQTVGIFSCMYLICFGLIGTMFFARVYISKSKMACLLITIISFLMLMYVTLAVGIIYIVSDQHRRIIFHETN